MLLPRIRGEITDLVPRESPPLTLLALSPTMFAQSIQACRAGIIDLESLRSGLSYFLEDPLSYTLPAALIWLVNEVQRTPLIRIRPDEPKQHSRSILVEVLSMLLDSGKCPPPVRNLVAAELFSFTQDAYFRSSLQGAGEGIDYTALGDRIATEYAWHGELEAGVQEQTTI